MVTAEHVEGRLIGGREIIKPAVGNLGGRNET